jgi:hypothetical protein
LSLLRALFASAYSSCWYLLFTIAQENEKWGGLISWCLKAEQRVIKCLSIVWHVPDINPGFSGNNSEEGPDGL